MCAFCPSDAVETGGERLVEKVGNSTLYEGSRGQIQGAIDSFVKRAIKSCDISWRSGPFDLLRALIGVSHMASGPDWQQSARRLVDILITGSRPLK
jgi:hypothetical protein